MTFSHRIQRQLSSLVNTPPMAGPMPLNSAVAPPHTPTARPRREPRKPSVTIASDPGVSTAAPTPATTIAAISHTAPWASAPATDAAMYSSVPITTRRTRPNWSASRPAAMSRPE
jgi:hypothetical protein